MSDIQKVDEIDVLELGQSGENQVRTIRIDVGAWVEQWPDASIFIVALRAGDTVPYVVTTEREGTILSWTVQAVDAAKIGVGYVEVRAQDMQGIVKKTRIIRTVVDRSLSDVDAEDPNNEFLTRMLSAAAQIMHSKLYVVRYEDGSVELSGGMAEDGGYLLDATLTEEGKAADAKAVGAALDKKADVGSGIYDPLKAWPIGSIYMSEDDTSPADLFGGEWESVEGMFLLGSNETYSVGATGGADTVTLTADQVPKGV